MFVEHKEQGEVTEAPAKLDDVSGLLLKAADYMERVGKCGVENDCGIDAEGRVCAFQALNKVFHGNWSPGGVLDLARRRLARRFGGREAGVTEWSDTSPQESVVSTMRAVALGL